MPSIRIALRGLRMADRAVWIVENGQEVKYTRTGECNGCGECCLKKIAYRIATVDSKQQKKKAEGSLADWEGWAVTSWHRIDWWVKATTQEEEMPPCQYLKDKRCELWGTNDFPAICALWPMQPSDIAAFPNCGFRIERANA